MFESGAKESVLSEPRGNQSSKAAQAADAITRNKTLAEIKPSGQSLFGYLKPSSNLQDLSSQHTPLANIDQSSRTSRRSKNKLPTPKLKAEHQKHDSNGAVQKIKLDESAKA